VGRVENNVEKRKDALFEEEDILRGEEKRVENDAEHAKNVEAQNTAHLKMLLIKFLQALQNMTIQESRV
jgi:hypothetical protein